MRQLTWTASVAVVFCLVSACSDQPSGPTGIHSASSSAASSGPDAIRALHPAPGAAAHMLVPAGLSAPATSTRASTVTCGVPVTRSLVLTEDLSCPTGDALVVGADHITVDLGGHSVTASRYGPYAAVRNPGHDGVTIRDGSADGSFGVLLEHGAQRNRILGLAVFGQTDGIALHDSHENLLRGNESFVGSGHGILLRRARGNTLDRNVMAQENDDGNAHGGIWLTDSSNGNRITNNVTSSNGSDGIYVSAGSRRNLIAANTATWNVDDGIDVDDPNNIVSRNVTNENQGFGIEAAPGTRGGNNSASGNREPTQCLNIPCN
jgi:parallel beta-helix repeat protein